MTRWAGHQVCKPATVSSILMLIFFLSGHRFYLQKVGPTERIRSLQDDHASSVRPCNSLFTFRIIPLSGSTILIHRSALIAALQSGLPPTPICTIHTSARLVSFSYSSPGDTNSGVVLHFADGSTRQADVVVGADGVRSAVRDSMFPGGIYVDRHGHKQVVEPKWTGVIAYRSLVTRQKLESYGLKNHRSLVDPLIVSVIHSPAFFGSLTI